MRLSEGKLEALTRISSNPMLKVMFKNSTQTIDFVVTKESKFSVMVPNFQCKVPKNLY